MLRGLAFSRGGYLWRDRFVAPVLLHCGQDRAPRVGPTSCVGAAGKSSPHCVDLSASLSGDVKFRRIGVSSLLKMTVRLFTCQGSSTERRFLGVLSLNVERDVCGAIGNVQSPWTKSATCIGARRVNCRNTHTTMTLRPQATGTSSTTPPTSTTRTQFALCHVL